MLEYIRTLLSHLEKRIQIMNLIKNFRNILSLILVLFTLQNIEAKNLKPIHKESCEEKKVTVKTEFKSKYKYFFFRKTNWKKVKMTNQVVDENGKVIIKITMKSTENGDQYLFRKFHRLVIIEKEIHEVICGINKENGKVIIYNFCGEKMNEFNMKADELFEKYKF